MGGHVCLSVSGHQALPFEVIQRRQRDTFIQVANRGSHRVSLTRICVSGSSTSRWLPLGSCLHPTHVGGSQISTRFMSSRVTRDSPRRRECPAHRIPHCIRRLKSPVAFCCCFTVPLADILATSPSDSSSAPEGDSVKD